jgi:hypothetical protein
MVLRPAQEFFEIAEVYVVKGTLDVYLDMRHACSYILYRKQRPLVMIKLKHYV